MKQSFRMKQVITKICKQHNFDYLAGDGSGITLGEEGGAFMPLAITALGKNVLGVAHKKVDEYWHEISYDPEITFWVNDGKWYPITMEQPQMMIFGEVAGGYEELVIFKDGKPDKLNPYKQAGVARFTTTWASNIKHQGFGDKDIEVTRHGC